jgi:hypothetical protein
MKLGSHNTMTYLRPKVFWQRLLPFVGRCQSVDYKVQHSLGAVGYDLRLFWDDDGKLEYRHGFLRFPADNIDEVLSYAESNNIIVRVLLEVRSYNKPLISNIDELRSRFKAYCSEIEEKYPSILFFGGQESGSGEKLYTFKNETSGLVIDELHSSVTSLFKSHNKFLRMIDDLFPIIYSLIKNEKNIRAYQNNKDKENTYLYVDYVEVQ